jgi:hypothetical protein
MKKVTIVVGVRCDGCRAEEGVDIASKTWSIVEAKVKAEEKHFCPICTKERYEKS